MVSVTGNWVDCPMSFPGAVDPGAFCATLATNAGPLLLFIINSNTYVWKNRKLRLSHAPLGTIHILQS